MATAFRKERSMAIKLVTMSVLVLAAAGAFRVGQHEARGALTGSGTLFVDLDASDASAGTATWTNNGTLADFAEFGNPVVGNFGPNANNGVSFDGTNDYYRGPAAPIGLTGVGAAGSRSIEVWVFNPSVATEEGMVSLAKRGGGTGTNVSFNYGTDGAFGAVGKWGTPDIGWGAVPTAGQWHHLVYTYDGNATRVYEGGTLQNFESIGAVDAHDGIDMLIAAQMEPNGTSVTPTLRGSLSLGRVRVHDGVLTDADVKNNHNETAGTYGLQTAATHPGGSVIGDWQFNRDTFSSIAVANGQAVAGSSAVDTAALRDDSNTLRRGSIIQTPHYGTYAVSELAGKTNVDGFGLRTGGSDVGEGYVFFNGEAPLSTNDTFSVWGRVKQLSNLGGDQFIFSRPGRWDLRVDNTGNLLTSFAGNTNDTGFDVAVGDWYDIGLVYSGTGIAGTDVIEMYVNGSSLGTFDANAFDTGDWFHIGAGGGGGNDFHGLFDRVIFWDEAVSASVMQSLSASVIPEPQSFLLASGALLGLLWVFRRRRN